MTRPYYWAARSDVVSIYNPRWWDPEYIPELSEDTPARFVYERKPPTSPEKELVFFRVGLPPCSYNYKYNVRYKVIIKGLVYIHAAGQYESTASVKRPRIINGS